MKLRQRVTVALVAVVGLFVVVQSVLAYLSLAEQEDELVDELVMAEAQRLAKRAERGELNGARGDALLAGSANLSVWLVEGPGKVRPAPLPAPLADLGDGPHRLTSAASELHVVVLPTVGGRLVVQYDAESNEDKVRTYGLYLLGLAALCIALGAAVSWRVAGWVVGPIERLAARLADWVPDASDTGLALVDEESRLLASFQRVQQKFEAAIALERAFVANVGHEIRTPLAALRTDLEMLEAQAVQGSATKTRLHRALDAVDNAASALESARSLTRRQQVAASTQRVAIARCVDDAWESLDAIPGRASLRFVNEVPTDATVVADRHALLTILRNLLRNAVEHAAPTTCTVRLTACGIEVADDGPGIAAHDLPFIFDRFYRGRLVDSPLDPDPGGADDRGLGLAIARQLADVNGWRLTAETVGGSEPASSSSPARGARFVLSLEAI